MKLITKAVSAFVALSLTACGGGGGGSGSGGSSTGGVQHTHTQLANDFVYRLNIDGGYDVELMKTNTLQFNYIVVYDHDYDTYDAYDLTGYNPGENVNNFLDRNESYFYYDLDYIGANQYQDYFSGIIFEKTTMTSTDRLKVAALEEGLNINKAAKLLNAQYGLSQERSFEVAKLASSWNKLPAERKTDATADMFTKEVLGHSITEYKAAVDKKVQGDASELNELIENTAQFNGVLPEQMNQIVSGIVGVEL